MKFRITVLCENSVGPISGSLGEHGFSALIDSHSGEQILFDTGAGATLLHNARCMNKDLSAVSKVALSHGHYDHTGGLLPLLQECGPKRIYCHPGLFRHRYRVKDTGECRPIGIPHSRAELEAAGADFDVSPGFREIAKGVYLSGEIPRISGFEKGDQGLYYDCSGQELDSAVDDQSLVLETEKGLVLLMGCCHSGVINTLEQVSSSLGRRDFHAIVGGTHLGFCGRDQLDMTIASLSKWGIKKVAASHCTGFPVSARLSREMPKEFQVAQVGYTLEV